MDAQERRITFGELAAPLNPRYRADELRFYLEDLGTRVLITGPDGGEAARAAAGEGVLRLRVLGPLEGLDLVPDDLHTDDPKAQRSEPAARELTASGPDPGADDPGPAPGSDHAHSDLPSPPAPHRHPSPSCHRGGGRDPLSSGLTCSEQQPSADPTPIGFAGWGGPSNIGSSLGGASGVEGGPMERTKGYVPDVIPMVPLTQQRSPTVVERTLFGLLRRSLWPYGALYITIAVVAWNFFSPSMARMQRFEFRWIAEIYLRNVVVLVVLRQRLRPAGGLGWRCLLPRPAPQVLRVQLRRQADSPRLVDGDLARRHARGARADAGPPHSCRPLIAPRDPLRCPLRRSERRDQVGFRRSLRQYGHTFP